MYSREELINFETLAEGVHGGYGKHEYLIINSQSIFDDIWASTFKFKTPPPKPEINFTKNTIIAVFYGWFITGGFTIQVIKIRERSSQYTVYVEETYPGPGSVVTMASTNPYHIVVIEKLTKNVNFLTSHVEH